MRIPAPSPSRVIALAHVVFMFVFLLLFVTADAEAQRSGQRGRDKRAKTSATKKPAAKKEKKPQVVSRSRTRNAPATSQRAVPVEMEPTGGPADLARQTFEGRASSAPGRTKRPAPASPPLTAEQLQMLTAYQREVDGVPLKGYAEPERLRQPLRPLYAEGSIGLYLTAGLRAGFSGNSWPYDYSAQLAVHTTNGFINNGSRSGFSIGAKGGYIIDDGYGIFSGGHMGAGVEYSTDNYHRYAAPGAPERSRSAWSIGMDGQNSYNGTTFELRGGYGALSLEEAELVTESSLDGGVDIRVPYMGLTIGGGADLHLTQFDGTSISFGKFDAHAKYSNAIFAIRGGFSLGAGDNSDGSTTAKIAPLAEINLFPLHGVTIAAGITGGLSRGSMRQLLATNPYIVLDPLIRHEVERIGYRGTLRIEPAQAFALRLSGGIGEYDTYSFFRETAGALFAPNYGKATITKIAGDIQWEITSRSMLAASATFMESLLDTAGTQVPYVPKWDAEVLYTQRLVSLPLSITAIARYIGQRNGTGGAIMAAVPILGLKGRYAITSLFDATLELGNLTNARYELWPGYRERGFFAAVGAGVRY